MVQPRGLNHPFHVKNFNFFTSGFKMGSGKKLSIKSTGFCLFTTVLFSSKMMKSDDWNKIDRNKYETTHRKNNYNGKLLETQLTVKLHEHTTYTCVPSNT